MVRQDKLIDTENSTHKATPNISIAYVWVTNKF